MTAGSRSRYCTRAVLAWWCVAAGVAGQLKDCSRSEHERCISLAEPLLREAQLVFPDNERDLQLVCVTWNQFVDCLKGYTDRCFTVVERSQFNRAVSRSIDSVHEMCTQKAYQQEYLQHAGCLKSTVTQPQHCGAQYSQLVEQVSQGQAIGRARLCCSHDRFKQCVAREAGRLCGAGVGARGGAVRFAAQTLDKALGFLQDQCRDHVSGSEDCGQLRRGDDQLLLSTAPWLSTRPGDDADDGPTGGSAGGTDGGSTSGSTGGSTGGTGWTGGSDRSDSGTDGSTVGDTNDTGDTARPTDALSALLGSRTRPSSYGRSAGWDGGPGPTAPAGPHWSATPPPWQVYREAGAAAAAATAATAAATTTETWYPAAGSYVGNEVDEPNQLGLSKPRNGAHATHPLAAALLLGALLVAL